MTAWQWECWCETIADHTRAGNHNLIKTTDAGIVIVYVVLSVSLSELTQIISCKLYWQYQLVSLIQFSQNFTPSQARPAWNFTGSWLTVWSDHSILHRHYLCFNDIRFRLVFIRLRKIRGKERKTLLRSPAASMIELFQSNPITSLGCSPIIPNQ